MDDDSKLISQVMTLAPAAGTGIGKAFADALTSDKEFLPLLVSAAKDGLKANRSFWVKDGGGGYLEREPDIRSRIQTLALVLAHMEGEPVKRIIHQHLGAGDGKIDLNGALRESPELATAVESALQKARWRTSGTQEHKRPKKAPPVVEGETVPAGPAGVF